MNIVLLPFSVNSQIPKLPIDALTEWIVDEPQEIVSYLVFDPGTVSKQLPLELRFISVGELAQNGIAWANQHLSEYPDHTKWAISFIEIVRMKIFSIDGRQPEWPEQGAAALWFARVAASDAHVDLGPGQPFLALEFWLPDSHFVDYMLEKGHYVSYADVRLHRSKIGSWIGSVKSDNLNLSVECFPLGAVKHYSSGGMQVFFPPAQSAVKSIVRVAFAGHQIQECREDSAWKFKGDHPLVKSMILGSSTYQFGYDLVGAAYKN